MTSNHLEEEIRLLRSEVGLICNEVYAIHQMLANNDLGRTKDSPGRKKRKRSVKKRSPTKQCGFYGLGLAIATSVLCITGLFVASKSGEGVPRLLQVVDGPTSEPSKSPTGAPKVTSSLSPTISPTVFQAKDSSITATTTLPSQSPSPDGNAAASQSTQTYSIDNTTKSTNDTKTITPSSSLSSDGTTVASQSKPTGTDNSTIQAEGNLTTINLPSSSLSIEEQTSSFLETPNGSTTISPSSSPSLDGITVASQSKPTDTYNGTIQAVGNLTTINLPSSSPSIDEQTSSFLETTNDSITIPPSSSPSPDDTTVASQSKPTDNYNGTIQAVGNLTTINLLSSSPSIDEQTSSYPTTNGSTFIFDQCMYSSKLSCEAGNGDECLTFAETCCWDDLECQQKYKTKACEIKTAACKYALTLEQNGAAAANASMFCEEAETTCCGADYDVGGCRCDFWEPLCNSHPAVLTNSYDSCYWAADYCCGSGKDERSDFIELGSYCKCDLYSYAKKHLGYEHTSSIEESSCDDARLLTPDVARERDSLERFYNGNGGAGWHENSGWMIEPDHCSWFGISCDSDGYVIKVNLRGNNVTGTFPGNLIASLYKLQSLDLSNNELNGMITGNSTSGVWTESGSYKHVNANDTSMFFNLRELVHADLSRNMLSGEVDILFAPALKFGNFSYNSFTSVDNFKRFKKSHKTLLVADVSNNVIHQNISAILTNVPTQLEELHLSNNHIEGSLPETLETLVYMKRLYLDSNMLTGSLPDLSSSLPNLRELDLSNQKQAEDDVFSSASSTLPSSSPSSDSDTAFSSSTSTNSTIQAADSLAYVSLSEPLEGTIHAAGNSTTTVIPSPSPTSDDEASIFPSMILNMTMLSASYEEEKLNCLGANPYICGCGSVNQSDYRGMINTTESELDCLQWDDDLVIQSLGNISQQYPDDGLDNNYCRSPSTDALMTQQPWCYVNENGGVEENKCNIPYCMAGPLLCSTFTTFDYVRATNELKYACNYHQCANSNPSVQPTYDTFLAPLRDEVDFACLCSFEIWDCEYGSSTHCGEAHKCCIDQMKDFDSSPMDDSCECFLKLACEDGDGNKCVEFAETCCGDDVECQQEYKAKACALMTKACESELALEQNGVAATNASIYCKDAENTCCGGDTFEVGGCRCDFWDPIINVYPKVVTNGYDSSYWAADYCCGNGKEEQSGVEIGSNCKCDLYSYAENSLGYEQTSGVEGYSCDDAKLFTPDVAREKKSLEHIYNQTGGPEWLQNSGWLVEPDHCSWFGISCDSDGYVIKVNLRGNNVTGAFPGNLIASLYQLQILDLSDNKIRGMITGNSTSGVWTELGSYKNVNVNDTSMFFNLRELTHVDLSQNQLSGEVDILFAPALEHVNFSNNSFTSIDSFKRFKKSHKSLIVADLSHNLIRQEISNILTNVPTQLEELRLSNNFIKGSLPDSFETLVHMKKLYINSNMLSGSLPVFSSSFPNLQELDLSNQKQPGNKGFIGPIPDGMVDLSLLSILNLTANSLFGTIPRFLAYMSSLQKLDLSNNMFSKKIPKGLGKLKDNLELLDLSNNKLTGSIPFELSYLKNTWVHLNGNDHILQPAPLELCLSSDFDLKGNTGFCPLERNVLKAFYDSVNGGEWTVSSLWNEPYKSHCSWYGVACDDSNSTIKLDLKSNGLSGTLSPMIANLSSLRYLNLADNDIKGSIPPEIGALSNLTYLRLSHNSFMGSAPPELGSLQRLELIQLNGNRISGTMPELHLHSDDYSASVADCGNPSDFQESLVCTDCTICCNLNGECHPQEKTNIQKLGFDNYTQFSWVFFAALIAAYMALALLLSVHDKIWADFTWESTTKMDARHALKNIGCGSVYQFLLGTSMSGWLIVLATIFTQIGVLFVFVKGSEMDMSTKGKTDLIYTWICPRDVDECHQLSDLDWRGYIIFAVLMVAYLLKDTIGGAKMIILSAKQRHSLSHRMRFFCGGILLSAVTLFSLYVSSIYNYAIAKTNTEIVINSVVVLFICDLDEQFYEILMAINPQWVDSLCMNAVSPSVSARNIEVDSVRNNQQWNGSKVQNDVDALKKEFQLLTKKLTWLQQKMIEAQATPERDHDILMAINPQWVEMLGMGYDESERQHKHDAQIKNDVNVLENDLKVLSEKLTLVQRQIRDATALDSEPSIV